MPETIKLTAPVGSGLGKQSFSIKPGPGGGLELKGVSHTPLQTAALATPGVIDVAPEMPTLPPAPAVPPSPFERLYPGVDPAKVQMELDERGKLRLKAVAPVVETPPETPPTPIPVAPSEPDVIAQLRAEIAQQNQLQAAMLQSMATGMPLMEILSGIPAKPAEPDYSRFDLEEEEGRAAYAQAVRADAIAAAKAEFQAEMRNHMPEIQGAQRHGEYFAVQAEHGKDPDFQQKADLANQLVGANPNISFKATYNLISQIQHGLTNGKPAEPAKPGNPILTPAQQAEKAAQAAKYQGTTGGRATGGPAMPPGIKTFKQHAAWAAHQLALGYSPEDIAAAGKR